MRLGIYKVRSIFHISVRSKNRTVYFFRYSGTLREFGQAIDEIATKIWEHVSVFDDAPVPSTNQERLIFSGSLPDVQLRNARRSQTRGESSAKDQR